METIKEGSSEYLQRFSKSGSLHRATPPQNVSYNPYSMAEPDPSVNNGTLRDAGAGYQPTNYLNPVSSGGWDTEQRIHSDQSHKPVGTQSYFIPRPAHQVNNGVAATVDGTPNKIPGNGNPSHSPISHLERESEQRDHQKLQLARSKTATKSPDHLYEMDVTGVPGLVQSKPPLPNRPPPKVVSRNKQPLPQPRHTSGSLSDSQPPQSPLFLDQCRLSPDEPECCYVSPNSADKEPQYDIPGQPLEPRYDIPAKHPVPKERPKLRANGSPHGDLGASGKSKPLITPRKKNAHAVPLDPPLKQPNYLDLMEDNVDDEHVYNQPRVVSGSASKDGTDSSHLPPAFSEEMVQNFTPVQIGMLINMLQQVGDGRQQPVMSSSSTANSGESYNIADHSQIRKNFGQ